MRVAILGGGFTGLAASYYLSKKGHTVTLFEKETALGGLAGGFKSRGWNWYLERSVHHWFTNDYDILNFAKEIGFEGIFFKKPETASLYPNSRIIPLDSPLDLLRFPYLPLPQKLRTGLVLALLKISPFLPLYEQQTAKEFLQKTMGGRAWEGLWKELFRKKFGKYAENIVASFFWARIKKRTQKLGYPEGGFQALINHTEKALEKYKVVIKKGCQVRSVKKEEEKFTINEDVFDAVVSTLPTPVLLKVTKDLLPATYNMRLRKIKFQHAISLILETKKPLLPDVYWLNMVTRDIPIMGLFQHTNFIDKSHYGENHILYVGNYVDFDDPRIRMGDEETLKWYLPYLKKINENWSLNIENYFVFKGPFAQPIFDKEFLKNKPDFITPVKNFFIANLDMTYPYDRGTNYAVKLGREVSTYF